jgi:hypothetical protein
METIVTEFDNEYDAREEAELQKEHFALEHVRVDASVKVYQRTMLPIPDVDSVELSRWFLVVRYITHRKKAERGGGR